MDSYRWEREIPVRGSYDVIVAGGGTAGLSAALAAARNGAKTLLIEREWALGGLATLGMIALYLPLCDGYGHQVSFGIAEELLRLAVEEDPEARKALSAWLNGGDARARAEGTRFRSFYDPWMLALKAEGLLKQSGADLLYGTQITGADVRDGRIRAVFAENKSGASAYEGRSFIDCTGDADLCAAAGAETAVCGKGNPLAAWYTGAGSDGVKLYRLGAADIAEEDAAGEDREARLTDRRFSGLDGDENTEMMRMAHESILRDVRKRRAKDPAFRPAAVTAIPEIRQTRRLRGAAEPCADPEAYPADCVGVIANWRKRGECYALPYGALYGNRIRNLAAAGRCVSVADDLWEYARVIPACAVTGEAAGTAAAMGADFGDVSAAELRERLTRQGAATDPERVSAK